MSILLHASVYFTIITRFRVSCQAILFGCWNLYFDICLSPFDTRYLLRLK
jgi:hypothetical protein